MAITDYRAVNEVETGYSLIIRNGAMSGGLALLPPFESNTGPQLTGTFWKYDPRNMQKVGGVERAEDGTAYETRWIATTDTFKTYQKAKRTPINDIVEKYADVPVRPSNVATDSVVNELLLGHDIAAATLLTATASYPSSANYVTLSGTTQLSDFVNSDPLDVFADARLALKYVPYVGRRGRLVAVTSPEVIEVLRQHPDIKARYTNVDGMLTNMQLAEIMGVDELVVDSAFKDTGDDAAATATETRVWGKNIVIAYVDPTKEWGTMSFGFTVFSRMPDTAGIVQTPGYADGLPIRVRDYREEQRGGGTTWREADTAWDLKIVSGTFGYLIKDAVA